MKSRNETKGKKLFNFLFAGIGGAASCTILYPVETVNKMIQARRMLGLPTNILRVMAFTIQDQGLKDLFSGYRAFIIRSAISATLRAGSYFALADWVREKTGRPIRLYESAVCASATIVGASVISMPFETIYVRFKNDTIVPVAQKRNYKNLNDTASRIWKEGGFKELYEGFAPYLLRAVIMGTVLYTSYEFCKNHFSKRYGFRMKTYSLSAGISGFIACVLSMPLENIKLVMLHKRRDPITKQYPFGGIKECFLMLLKQGGLLSLWSGFLPFYFVDGLWYLIMLSSIEGFRNLSHLNP